MKGTITRDMFDCIPEIDFNSGYRYFLGNMDNYSHALMSILKSIKSKQALLLSMSNSGEYEGLRTIAQTLRKMLSNVGASGLAESTYQIETAVLNEDAPYLQEQLYPYIVGLVEFSEHLEMLLKNIDGKNSTKNEEEQSCFLNYDFTKTKESIKLSSNLLERKII